MSTSHPRFEPVLYAQAANAAVAMLVALHVITGALGDGITVAVAGAVALVTAFLTRPWVVTAITGAIQTCLTALVMLLPGVHLDHVQVGYVLAFVAAVFAVLTSLRVTPITKAASTP